MDRKGTYMKEIMIPVKEKDYKLKNAALASIQKILVSQYKVPSNLATTLIKRSKIDQIFDRNAEIAAHTSNKTWAQRAYEQLSENDKVSRLAKRNVSKTSKYTGKKKIHA